MSDLITLSCPSCGGRLEITKDMDRFVCAHCGNEHVVRRAGGTISLAPVMEGLQKVQASSDRVAAELAIQRLTRELIEAENKTSKAKIKLEAATKALALRPGILPAAALAAFSIMLTFGCGALTLLSYSAKADPGILLSFFIAGLVGSAITVTLAIIRNNSTRKLTHQRDSAKAELNQAEQTRQTILGERDKTRVAAGL